MTFREWFRKRLHRQGMKIERRYKDRPISKERYEKIMICIGAIILTYLVISFMCVLYVAGEYIGRWFI